MNWHEAIKICGAQPGDGLLKPLLTGEAEMHTANHCPHALAGSPARHIIKRVDHAGVRATQKHEQSFAEVNHHGLVIGQRVWLLPIRVKKERAAGVFKRVRARNFAGDKYAIEYFSPIAGFHNAMTLMNCLHRLPTHTDESHLAGTLAEFFPERSGMQEDFCVWRSSQHRVQSAGVIVMTVAQHNGVELTKFNAEGLGVAQNQVGLPGIEQQATAPDLNMKGQAMFGGQTAAVDAVFYHHGNANGFSHVVINLPMASGRVQKPAETTEIIVFAGGHEISSGRIGFNFNFIVTIHPVDGD